MGLDPYAIGLVILRKYLRYSRSKAVKRVGNSMLEYFINMVIAYKEARANYFACKGDYSEEIEQGIGSELNATDLESHPDLEDRILPGRLEATLLLIYCGLKNPVFRHALSSKRGAIWTRCYDLYHGTNQEIEKNLYPTLIHLEESVK